ncbi:MAG TPA: ferrochelatase [Candidatus Competibacteraceae bacterium]|nr:ferrochelatase [Candidatus Competibacteraceae bacterium]MCP5132299.1 ferrochelatase [Gammaproteobacteria bacterium]HPF59810.1 ferrochelatase [Candidatus Competibacteraceae bacterium]HRY18107.1 ferrochelatase [Candidatus Competibacteraceae bacterium]
MKSIAPPAFAHDRPACTGILLANLGTPDAPTPQALRRYLAEFLWDSRVVEIPRLLWWLILHGIILRIRPAQSARKYATIWTADGSPLLAISRRQAAALAKVLAARCPGPVRIALGMRYGNPSIASALAELRAAGAERLLVLPLYPQYSAATTASAFDAVAAELRTWRWLPELRFIAQYSDDPGYLDALATHIQAGRAGQPGDRLLFSFHGLPKRNLLAGDPYYCQCHKTARLVAGRLELAPEQWGVAFQSRFGRAEWLQPYTRALLTDWAKTGVKSVDVVCPGFAADCLETLEEIALENRQTFLDAGGEHYRYLPALNDAADHIAALAALIERHATGWLEFSPLYDSNTLTAERTARCNRARIMGAAA